MDHTSEGEAFLRVDAFDKALLLEVRVEATFAFVLQKVDDQLH